MSKSRSFVFVVDDDPAIRDSLQWLLESVNLPVKTFATGLEFLDSDAAAKPGCLILDIRMPGMSGTDVFEELQARNVGMPVIFLTGHGDFRLAARVMKAGAFDFVEKPYNDQLLLDIIQKAIRHDAEKTSVRIELDEIKIRLDQLTVRERQVLDGVVHGESNRAIAEKLERSEKTIEFHRAKMVKKMRVESFAELIKMMTIFEKQDSVN